MNLKKLHFTVILFSLILTLGFSFTLSTHDAFSLRDMDYDRDGIVDEIDECPLRSEVYNLFEDEDGCPDSVTEHIATEYQFPDTDGDGIEDRLDKCVDLPENFNDYLDYDGCPEIRATETESLKDSDSDTIADSIDVCPFEAEDFNDFKDGDGCPDSVESLPTSPKASTFSSDNCRVDRVEVLRFNSPSIVCVTLETALKWEEYGIAEIISKPSEEGPVVPPVVIKPLTAVEKIKQMPYPDQPEVHPNLLAANEFWSPKEVHKVTDGVWVAVGYDLANSIMIEGDDGLIIVDTLSTYEAAKEVIAEFRKITDKPVKAIIYTHGHLDHVHGTGAFLEEGEDIEIYAHDSHVEFYINENSVLGPIGSERSAMASGAFLPKEGPDRQNMGLFPKILPGTIAYAAPTQTFSDELEVEISGVKIKMAFVAGESSDQIYVWLPEKEVLLIGANISGIIPNIYTLRGSVYRDPMNYVNALDEMIPLEPEYLVPSHVKPITGKDNIKDVLISTRDSAQYIYDQTIRGMNQGYTADELSHMIELPEELENHAWLTKTRNQVSSHVKQIYYGNLGWYEGDPAFLTPISLKEKSQNIVNGFGGIFNTNSDVKRAIENGEYEWAAELATYAINTDPDNEESKLLKAHALRVLGQRSDSFDIRHWSLTEARVLEGEITIVPGAFTQTSPEQMAELPIDKLLKALPTKLDPEKAKGLDIVLGVQYSDVEQDFTLHVRNSILAVTDGFPDDPQVILSLDTATHKQIVSGHLSLEEAIEAEQIELFGDQDDVTAFVNLFDNLSVQAQAIG